MTFSDFLGAYSAVNKLLSENSSIVYGQSSEIRVYKELRVWKL